MMSIHRGIKNVPKQMEQIKQFIIDCESESELTQIEECVRKQKRDLEETKIVQMIKEEIQKKGYSVQIHFDGDVQDVQSMRLRYYGQVRCFDKEDYSDPVVIDYDQKQDTWVEMLHFKYAPSKKNFINFDPDDEWEIGDRDHPAHRRGYMCVTLYYKKYPCPSENCTFDAVCEEDFGPKNCFVQNGQVHIGNNIDRIDQWNICEIFVIPDSIRSKM